MTFSIAERLALMCLVIGAWDTHASQLPLLPSQSDGSISVPGNNSLFYCAEPASYLLNLTYVNISPDPPVAGQNVSIEAVGDLRTDIKNGSRIEYWIDTRVGYTIIPLLRGKAEICEQLFQFNKTCPLRKGPFTVETEVEIPEDIPKTTYLAEVTAYTEDAEELICLQTAVKF